MRVKFTKKYDHVWLSRAMTTFPEGYEGVVKKEVAEAAIAAGKAKEIESEAKKENKEADKKAEVAHPNVGEKQQQPPKFEKPE